MTFRGTIKYYRPPMTSSYQIDPIANKFVGSYASAWHLATLGDTRHAWASIAKYNRKAFEPFTPALHQALVGYLGRIFSPARFHTFADHNSILQKVNFRKSAGFGFSGQKHVVIPKYYDYLFGYIQGGWKSEPAPIWATQEKDETRLRSKLTRNYQTVCVPFQLLQAYICHTNSELLKQSCFQTCSAWGADTLHIPTLLALRLGSPDNPHRVYGNGDFTEFDSGFGNNVFDVVADFRKRNFAGSSVFDGDDGSCSLRFDETVDFVYNQLKNSILLCPDGHLFEKHLGNPSGSGTTTQDNIYGHVVILVSCILLFISKSGISCAGLVYDIIRQFICYGDDFAFSYLTGTIAEKFWHEYPDLVNTLYCTTVELEFFEDFEDLSFIGVSPLKHPVHGHFVPLYPTFDRLAASMVYKRSVAPTETKELSRLSAYWRLVYTYRYLPDTPKWKVHREFFSNTQDYLRESLGPNWRIICETHAPTNVFDDPLVFDSITLDAVYPSSLGP